MCQALPGPRCSHDTFNAMKAAEAAYEAAPPGTLERGAAVNALRLAKADYAATFKRSNPDLYEAARQVRREQVALMPNKPALNEPGLTEWNTLAHARHRLASVVTALYDDELQGKVSYDTTQGLYESAVMDVSKAEQAFKAVAWQQYDVEPLARDRLLEAQASGDQRRIRDAQAVYLLATDHTWPAQSQARYEAAHQLNDEKLLDKTWEEQAMVRYAQSELPKLARAASPHTSLVREGPGETMPPAPWVRNTPRAVGPQDAPQVRWLCEGGCSAVRFAPSMQAVLVRDPSPAVQRRLWAYGYLTSATGDPRVMQVSKVADLCAAAEGGTAVARHVG